jgi:MFS family permease
MAGPPIVASALLLARLTPHTSTIYLLGAYVLFGVGCGMVNAPITNTAVSGMPVEQAGVAGAIASTSRQVGSALGVAIIGSMVAVGTGGGFVEASHAAWAVIAGFGAAVVVLGTVSTGDWARGTAERNAVRLAGTPKEVPSDQGVPATR